MTSEVGICNNALVELGEDPILSLTEDSKPARLCNLVYKPMRDDLLRTHFWNFAVKRVELAKTINIPVFGFDNEYQLPSDTIRVVRTEDNHVIRSQGHHVDFRIEGDKLLSDDDTVKIEYIARIVDPNLFDANFTETLSLKIADKIAYNLSDNNTLIGIVRAKLVDKLKQAKSADGQEGIPYGVEADIWLNVRA